MDFDDAWLERVVSGFRARTLPKPDWTHEAHLALCWATLQDRTVPDAIDHLRDAIRAYNESVGTANTPTSGYHETLTRFYVGVVAHVGAAEVGAVLGDPRCDRTAALAHWTRERLMSTEARLGWLEPDLAPLPFAGLLLREPAGDIGTLPVDPGAPTR